MNPSTTISTKNKRTEIEGISFTLHIIIDPNSIGGILSETSVNCPSSAPPKSFWEPQRYVSNARILSCRLIL
jgi:hypothetical protein